jgi:hypothetical protein
VDNGHWPHQIYVREARRMVGEFVVNENHLKRITPTERSIGMGSYNMDSHNVQRYVDADGFVRNEGDVQVNPGGPYPIDYGAIIPKKADCENLLVVCAVSSSHIAYGSIRMEPVFMILGQSAVTAAAHAIDAQVAVQDIDYAELRKRLISDGQVLSFDRTRNGAAEPPHFTKCRCNNSRRCRPQIAARDRRHHPSGNRFTAVFSQGLLRNPLQGETSPSRRPLDVVFRVLVTSRRL